MVLVRLDEVKVTTMALGETVVTIELKLGGGSAVHTRVKEGHFEIADPGVKNVVELRATSFKCLARVSRARSAHAAVMIARGSLIVTIVA